jgi:DNA-binding PadR family transcriptional regulator
MASENNLPLQEPTFFILLSLQGGEKHGYAILKEVSLLSGGRVNLSTGTLYGALVRLLDQGLIEHAGEAENGDRRGKKSYRLTRGGTYVFEAEMARMERLLKAARARQNGGALV